MRGRYRKVLRVELMKAGPALKRLLSWVQYQEAMHPELSIRATAET